MKQKPQIYRQGDVLIISTSSIPQNLVKTKKVTLALGEVTGHHHSILSENVVGFAEVETALAKYIEVKESAVLTHQEHDPITLPKGVYKAVIQKEYEPGQLRNVAD